MFAPTTRKAWTCAHVIASVGWIGAITATLALAIVGLTSPDARAVTSSYVAMDALGRYVLAPFSVATLVTGVVLSLGTSWKLLRHYWVVIKLIISVAATAILALYLQTLAYLAEVAGTGSASLRSPTVIVHSVLALAALVAATVLAVYKPRGLTRRGRRAAAAAASRS